MPMQFLQLNNLVKMLTKYVKNKHSFNKNKVLTSLSKTVELCSHFFLILCTEGEMLMKCTHCSNLLTPWRDAQQGSLVYQSRE